MAIRTCPHVDPYLRRMQAFENKTLHMLNKTVDDKIPLPVTIYYKNLLHISNLVAVHRIWNGYFLKCPTQPS
jgi:hypothetical protein